MSAPAAIHDMLVRGYGAGSCVSSSIGVEHIESRIVYRSTSQIRDSHRETESVPVSLRYMNRITCNLKPYTAKAVFTVKPIAVNGKAVRRYLLERCQVRAPHSRAKDLRGARYMRDKRYLRVSGPLKTFSLVLRDTVDIYVEYARCPLPPTEHCGGVRTLRLVRRYKVGCCWFILNVKYLCQKKLNI